MPAPLPLHTVWRTRRDVRSLRGKKLYRQILAAFRRGHEKPGFRLTHYSVFGSEVHLIVEADSTVELSRGMQGLGVSMAKRINHKSRRSGAVFADRFFARKLRTPREVANAVTFLLQTRRPPPGPSRGTFPSWEPDFTSSSALTEDARERLLALPVTWLLRVGELRARAGPDLIL